MDGTVGYLHSDSKESGITEPKQRGFFRIRKCYLTLSYINSADVIYEIDERIYDNLTPTGAGQDVADLITSRGLLIQKKGPYVEEYLKEHVYPFLNLALEIYDGPRDPVTNERPLTKIAWSRLTSIKVPSNIKSPVKVEIIPGNPMNVFMNLKVISGLRAIDWDEMSIAS